MLVRLFVLWGFLWWLEDGDSWLLPRASNAGGIPPFGGADSASEGPPANLDSAKARGRTQTPVAPAVAASMAPTPSVPVAATAAESPHGPLAPPEAANLVEEAARTVLWSTRKPPTCWRRRSRFQGTASSWLT
ncbi:hypothetical protein V6N13_116297 [Hibiscus sabdariffa]